MKLKRIYEYLGEGVTLLNDRAIARCPSCCPPELPASPASSIGAAVTLASSVFRIDAVAMTNSSVMVTYTDGVSTLYVRLLTVAGDIITTSIQINPSVANVLSITSVCRLTDTTALVTYLTSGNLIGCRVLTIISSTSVTAGAEKTFACVAGSVPKVESLSSSQAIVTYIEVGNKAAVRVLDISGTTITESSELIVSSTTITFQNIDVVDSSHAVVSYYAEGPHLVRAKVVLITGSVPTTPGAEYDISSAGVTTSRVTEVKMQNSSKGIVTWADAGNILKSVIITIAGTVITPNTTYNFVNAGSAFSGVFLSIGRYVMSYTATASGTIPHVNLSTTPGTQPIEYLDAAVGVAASFEFAMDQLTPVKAIGIFLNFSDSSLRAFVVNI